MQCQNGCQNRRAVVDLLISSRYNLPIDEEAELFAVVDLLISSRYNGTDKGPVYVTAVVDLLISSRYNCHETAEH